MKYVLLPQLSFRNAQGKLDYDKDSNYVFNKGLQKSLRFHGHESVIILPDTYPKLFGNNPMYSRFQFDFEDALDIIIDHEPDIVLENDPCRVMCWNILRFQEKFNFKVYTYNHWLDTVEDPKINNDNCTYMYRQYEGHMESERSYLNSDFAIQLLKKNSRCVFGNSLGNNIYKMPPFVDLEELDQYKNNKREKIIVFNHRLSEIDYYKTNVQNFLHLLKSVPCVFDHKVIFTNPTSKNAEWIVEELNAMCIKHEFVNLERAAYLDLISRSAIGFCLFEHPGMWSISALEMSYFTSVLGLDRAGYSELLHPSCKFKSLKNLHAAVEQHLKHPIKNTTIVKSVDVKLNKYIKNFIA